MEIRLHANATTTPKIRKQIQESTLPNSHLAAQFGVTVDTIRRWKGRNDTQDHSHTPHHLPTTLTPEQEIVAVELRRTFLLPLDDLLIVMREFVNSDVSRSGLDRCLRRHKVSRLRDLIPQPEGEKKPVKTFKDYEPGYIHVDYKYLPQMPDESSRRYLFVAIDRASRWVYLELCPDKSAKTATGFLKRLTAKVPFKIVKLLSDNDKCFTDRFSAEGERQPTGKHLFDVECARHGIEHRLIKPRTPQTNGMVERFNGRIADILTTTRFDSRQDLAATLTRYAWLYNQQIPQKALNHKTPVATLKAWQLTHPHLFHKQVRNHPGPNKPR
ncbi:IS481 family transposase [Magnetofaba australis]|uniref:Putative integrase catalytic subunit n=1 Tax=Magnetofaba australis IT-1 TaxID=1434232 RepID=A0A1Y2K6H5_9PROT|nr:IS481 family transposase [Magnetofaba australis]OSM04041.1 putative integrase catalytic subunit [Magnetofaba australis IT-1]